MRSTSGMQATMMTLCMRYCKNREEAEDLLQEGFIKVFQKISTFRGQGSLEGWIRRILINHPEGYRIVFNLYVFENYSHKEIADQLGISENTSKSQLSRARGYLRKVLTDQATDQE